VLAFGRGIPNGRKPIFSRILEAAADFAEALGQHRRLLTATNGHAFMPILLRKCSTMEISKDGGNAQGFTVKTYGGLEAWSAFVLPLSVSESRPRWHLPPGCGFHHVG